MATPKQFADCIRLCINTRRKDGTPFAFLGKGPPGIGKCLGKSTPVLKFDGSIVPVETLQADDLLMGPDSLPRKIISSTCGNGPLFKIVPRKGDPWVCTTNHVLTLINTDTKNIVDIEVRDFLKKSANFKQRHKLFQPQSVNFLCDVPCGPISPYFLGIWLGDGTKDLRSISITKPDAEIKQACEEEAEAFGLTVKTRFNSNRCPTFVLSNSRGKGNRLLETMRALMTDEIRVPPNYKYNSKTIRAQVLAGLLDTDGSPIPGGYEIAQKSPYIAEDIAFLARSLGLRVTQRPKIVNDTIYCRLSIFGENCLDLPLRIARKLPKKRNQIKNALVTGFHVEVIEEGEYFGFELDGDGRFLLGDFTVTHNTSIARQVTDQFEGFKFWDTRVFMHGLEDWKFPIVDQTKKTIDWVCSLLPMEPDWKGVICLDEFDKANRDQQAIALQLALDHKIGGRPLPCKAHVVLLANRLEDLAGGHRIITPINDRCMVVELEVSHEEHHEYALKENWDETVTTFLWKVKPDLLFKFEPAKGLDAWPSPRKWEMVSACLPGCHNGVRGTALCGLVGAEAAGSFETFIKLRDKMPDVDKVLANATKAPIPKDPSILWALCGALVQRLRKADKDLLAKGVCYLERLDEEYGIYAGKDIVSVNPKVLDPSVPGSTDYLKKLMPYLKGN